MATGLALMAVRTLITALCLLLLSGAARADWRNDIAPATLSGQGDFRFLGIRIFSAQLWAVKRPFDLNSPFALSLTYHHRIRKERLVSTSLDEMQQVQGKNWQPEKGQIWKNAMLKAFPEVEEGDTLTGVNLPGQGARFYHNGKLTTDIPDVEFANAFFGIWLSPQTSQPALRQQLLSPGPTASSH